MFGETIIMPVQAVVDAWHSTLLNVEESFSGISGLNIRVFVAVAWLAEASFLCGLLDDPMKRR